MKLFTVSGRASLLAAAGLSIMTAAGAMAQEVTVWYWDPNFNGAAMQAAMMKEGGGLPPGGAA